MALFPNDRRRAFAKGAVAAAMAAALCAAQAQPIPTTVRLGTATPGGGFQLYGQALAEVINEVDATLRVEARATKGSGENLTLLAQGSLDIALVEGNAAHQAFTPGARPPADLKILAAMYPNPGMFVVRADSAYRRIEDLKGRRVAFGTRASGLVILARDVLDGLGLEPERDFEAVFLEKAAEGPRLVLDGEVAALWGGGIGWPGFAQVAGGPHGARFIAPRADEIERIQARHAFLKTMTVPAGTYPGQDEAIVSVGLWAFVLARSTLPDELAYRLARALHRGEDALAKRLTQGRYTTAANTASQAPRRDLIHPGVARYLRELGLAVR